MVFDYTCKSNLDLQNLCKQSNLPALAHENAKYKIKKQTCAVIKPITGHHGLHDLLAQLITQSIHI